MANQKPLCFAVQPPAMIRSTPENNKGGMLYRVMNQVKNRMQEVAGIIKPIEGMRAEYEALTRQLMGVDGPEQLLNVLRRDGMIDETGDVARLSGSLQDTAMYGYAVRNYLEATGGGLEDLATNLEAKRMAGENVTHAALAFLEQATHVQSLVAYAMEVDLELGRGVYARRWLKSGVVDRAMKRTGLGRTEAQKVMLAEQGDVLYKARKALNSGNPREMKKALNDLGRLARAVKQVSNPLKAAILTANSKHLGDMLWTVAVNGMLSGPATWTVNATNLLYAMARPMFQYVPAKTWVTLTGDQDAAKAALQASVMMQQTYQGFMDGARLAWSSIRTGKSLYGVNPDYDIALNGGINPDNFKQMIDQNRFLKESSLNKALEPNSTMWDLIKFAGDFVNVPSRIVTATDDWTKHIVIRQQLAKQGVERALKSPDVDIKTLAGNRDMIRQALTKEDIVAYGPGKGLSDWNLSAPDFRKQWQFDRTYEHYDAIMNEAAYVAFQSDNEVAAGVEKMLQRAPFMRPFFPFVRTPLNILSQGIFDTTPIGAAAKSWGLLAEEGHNPIRGIARIHNEIVQNKAKDPAAFYTHMGQVAVGTTMLMTVYGMVHSGQMTGGGPARWSTANDKYKMQNAWEKAMQAQGKLPYGIKTPLGVMTFDRFPEPFAVMLRIVADQAEYAAYMDQSEQDSSFAMMAMIAGAGLYNSSFLTGFEELIEATDMTESGWMKKKKMAQGYAATFTPFGGLLKYLRSATGSNPYRVETLRGSYSMVDDTAFSLLEDMLGTGLFSQMAARIPGFSGNAMQIDPVTGAPIPSYPGMGPQGMNPLGIAVPVFPRGIDGDEVWDRIWKIRGSFNPQTSGSAKLNPYEQEQYNRAMAEGVIGGRTLRQAIMEFSERADVKQHIDDETSTKRRALASGLRRVKKTQIETEFDQIVRRYGALAEQVLASSNRNFAERKRLAKLLDMQAERGDTNAMNQISRQIRNLEKLAIRNRGEDIPLTADVQLPLRF